MGILSSVGRQTGGRVREEFGNGLLLVPGHVGRGPEYRRQPGSQMVDRPVSVAQLDCRLLHRHEGNTVFGKGDTDFPTWNSCLPSVGNKSPPILSSPGL